MALSFCWDDEKVLEDFMLLGREFQNNDPL